jgi:hypothetical protein
MAVAAPVVCGLSTGDALVKKENQNFLIFKEIQNGAVAKSYRI